MSPDSSPLTRFWQGILDLVFPPHCVGCQRPGVWFCDACLLKVQPLSPPTCRLCDDPRLPGEGGDLCRACLRAPLRIDGIRSVSLHQGTLRHAVHNLKYRRQRDLAAPLGRLLRDYLLAHSLPADILVPVPLHPSRLRQRGFNQSVLLAGAVATESLPVVDGCLQRVRSTQAQMTLGREARRRNVAGAFACQDERMRGRRVLLIDDVCTTGATLEACAIGLRQGGAVSVWALTLTREPQSLVAVVRQRAEGSPGG